MVDRVVQPPGKRRSRRSEPLATSEQSPFNPNFFLLQTAERYRAIIEDSDDAIISKTLEGIVTSWNQGAERIFGYPAGEMIGHSIKRIIPAELFAEEQFILLELEQGNRLRHFDTIRIAKDGRRIPVSLTVSPIRDANGVVIGASKIARDISERKQAEATAKAAIESARQAHLEAERANHAKTEFLAVMSHEIRTPLTSIGGFTDLLMRSENLTRDQRRYIDLIRTANAALRTVVDDILDFSKVDSGQFELELRPFSPRALVHDTLSVAHVVAAQKNLRLQYHVEREIPDWLMGDDARLRQILLNLVGNAIKFTSHGSIEIKVTQESSTEAGKNVRFSVSDTGIGVPADQQDRLFKPFSQADGSISRRYGGTGLGLAICKRLVELMGGRIGITSAPGEGSTFWFTFGLVEAPASAVEPEDDEEPAKGESSHVRILVVDDLDTNREIVEAYLDGRGYRVAGVASAIDAIQMLGSQTFDLVLMDIQMPVMDGVTATRRIRALPKPMRDVPILAMTGNVLPMQIKSFLDAGMNGHIAKPISRAKLHESVRRWGAHRDPPPDEPPSNGPAAEDGSADELVAVLGAERAMKIANDLLSQLNGAFRADCTLAEAQRQAHALINCAGILGLPRFVAACRAIESQPAGDAASERSALTQVRAERGLARNIILGQLLPRLQIQSLRPTG